MRRWMIGFLTGFLLLTPSGQAQPLANLDAPVSEAVIAFAQGSIDLMKFSMDINNVRPQVIPPGWLPMRGSGWEFYYPADWLLRDAAATYAWVSDQRDVAHVLFVQYDQVPGTQPMESLFYKVFSDTIVPRASSSDFRLIATDQRNMFGAYAGASNAGLSQVWLIRWLDARMGNMIASIQVTMLAQTYMYTAYGWSMTSFPEAEVSSIVEDVLTPLAYSFYATPPQDSGVVDTDGDGYPDSTDRYPNDPNYS